MDNFHTDKQTLADLHLLDDRVDSVFACFNRTITYGGEDALRELFRKPSTDLDQLQQRHATIRFLMDHVEELCLDKTTVDFLDYYLKSPERPVSFSIYRGIRNVVNYFFHPIKLFMPSAGGLQKWSTF